MKTEMLKFKKSLYGDLSRTQGSNTLPLTDSSSFLVEEIIGCDESWLCVCHTCWEIKLPEANLSAVCW